jgi:Fe2+ transport system protein B
MDKDKISNKTNKLKKIIKSKIYLISTIQKKGLEDLKKSLIANVYK